MYFEKEGYICDIDIKNSVVKSVAGSLAEPLGITPNYAGSRAMKSREEELIAEGVPLEEKKPKK